MSFFTRNFSMIRTAIRLKNYSSKNIKLYNQQSRNINIAKPLYSPEKIPLKFKLCGGEIVSAQAKLGDNLLDVIVDNDIDIDGFGACEGTLACSTCHLVLTEHQYKIKGEPSDEELDMLDLALGLQDTSRLGCQVIVTEDMTDWVLAVPDSIVDAR